MVLLCLKVATLALYEQSWQLVADVGFLDTFGEYHKCWGGQEAGGGEGGLRVGGWVGGLSLST